MNGKPKAFMFSTFQYSHIGYIYYLGVCKEKTGYLLFNIVRLSACVKF